MACRNFFGELPQKLTPCRADDDLAINQHHRSTLVSVLEHVTLPCHVVFDERTRALGGKLPQYPFPFFTAVQMRFGVSIFGS
jgi:hypothetical protein